MPTPFLYGLWPFRRAPEAIVGHELVDGLQEVRDESGLRELLETVGFDEDTISRITLLSGFAARKLRYSPHLAVPFAVRVVTFSRNGSSAQQERALTAIALAQEHYIARPDIAARGRECLKTIAGVWRPSASTSDGVESSGRHSSQAAATGLHIYLQGKTNRPDLTPDEIRLAHILVQWVAFFAVDAAKRAQGINRLSSIAQDVLSFEGAALFLVTLRTALGRADALLPPIRTLAFDEVEHACGQLGAGFALATSGSVTTAFLTKRIQEYSSTDHAIAFFLSAILESTGGNQPVPIVSFRYGNAFGPFGLEGFDFNDKTSVAFWGEWVATQILGPRVRNLVSLIQKFVAAKAQGP
jgi:hypothetical protein